ncbi:hypothetical protein [Rouxiella sp. WC2420]|uniref:Uncharacterized protein n=1 Tax=Rouxiella sp. WC2420 TaxID=3234145 RepID=A0AB39VN03_9GAMM
MTPEESRNALRSAARRCNDELHQAIADNPKVNFDTLSGPIIQRHYSAIKPLFRLVDFLWTIGVMNGQFKER